MGYAFIGPSGSHAEQLRNALHNLRRHVQDGEPLDEFYLDVPQLLETAVDFIAARVEEARPSTSAVARCEHGKVIVQSPSSLVYPTCLCCGCLYIDPHNDGGTPQRCPRCR